MGLMENSYLQSPLRGWMGLIRRRFQGLMPLATNGRHSVANTLTPDDYPPPTTNYQLPTIRTDNLANRSRAISMTVGLSR